MKRDRKAEHLYITFIDNVCDPLRPGRSGHSDIIWEVSRHLLDAGHRVRIVADYRAHALPFDHERLKVVTFQAHPFDRRNGLGKVRHVLRAYRRAAALPDTDIFFTTDAFSAGVVSLLSRRVPVVFLTPANIYQRQASTFKLDPIAETFYRVVSHYAARLSAHIIATSNDLKGWWLKTGACAERLSVIPLGIDAQTFAGLPRSPAPATLRLLYVARFEGDNNPGMLVSLARHLRARGVAFELTAVGDGRLLGAVKEEAARAGVGNMIRFQGQVNYEDLPAVYAAHDVFVFMREAGGPPRVVIQAMASGMAVVAFNSSGLEDYVDAGQSGFLVANGYLSELAAVVSCLSADRALLERVQVAAKARVAERFDWRAVTERYLQTLPTVLKRAA